MALIPDVGTKVLFPKNISDQINNTASLNLNDDKDEKFRSTVCRKLGCLEDRFSDRIGNVDSDQGTG